MMGPDDPMEQSDEDEMGFRDVPVPMVMSDGAQLFFFFFFFFFFLFDKRGKPALERRFASQRKYALAFAALDW